MTVLQIKIPNDRDDRETIITLDPSEVQKALAGQAGGACVVISRVCGGPLHVRAQIERVAA